ncbi:hypothetical protein VTI74DRAFT_10257 [Chaetomium olivicolor]
MADMGLQLEPISQSLEQYGPWHFQDARFQQSQRAELEAALLQTATIPGLEDTLREISRASRAECQSPAIEATTPKAPRPVPRGETEIGSSTASPPLTSTSKTTTLLPATLDPWLALPPIAPSGEVVSFPLRDLSSPRPCLKRRRPATDVDGHNTASLGCKKRRLLRHLITSRLSQPFSLPATHILNREAVATGDKRFLKLAAIMASRRLASSVTTSQPSPPQQPSPSTWLRRAAVLNSLRHRVCAEAAERGTIPVVDLAAKAAVLQHHQGHGSGTTSFISGRYLIAAPPNNNSLSPAAPRTPSFHRPVQTLNPSAPRPPDLISAPPSPTLPAAPVTTGCTTRLRIPSPTLRPLRSPELRVTRPLVPLEDIEDIDEGGFAFPTSEHESRYMCDDDDEEGGGSAEGEGAVYADFSVIFGGGSSTVSGDDDEEGEGYWGAAGGLEEYELMDDLDGIPSSWGGRC